jgi:hypothetical protein
MSQLMEQAFLKASSTVSHLPFVYVQRGQAITLFPVIQACEFVASEALFAFL